ncbi:CerR family C-terminal domain-containing protein [Dyella sp. C11]|uniref:CerR family C-terminal domain-containing protein n=1 Tax=Dyella sp. C11 TaxID=2126991 RepID=UPI000D6579AC|nr:CerR family C-terminal domain-containing protein [Dyella sp. C11]
MSPENTPQPRRRPSSGGYARGEEQRIRLIEAALRVFGDEGYERASTRKIAQAAGVQPPALQYYFDSKEGLSRACGEFIADEALKILKTPLEQARALPAGASRDDALESLHQLMDALVDASLFSKSRPERALFMARNRHESSPASEVLREQLSKPLMATCAQLVARTMEREEDDEVRLRTGLLLGQLTSLHPLPGSPLERLGWANPDAAQRAKIKAVLRAHTRGALSAPVEP